ncbi:hypothetical protein BSKO_02324 [Bryopsis sp. KO-2023]|nr:hypothetical protein BSKO_02324 [Bryopsis sp. KO-2023]
MRVSTVVRAFLLLAYVVVAGYYFYKRSQDSLDVHWLSYGRFIIFLEVLVASVVVLYGITLTRRVKIRGAKDPVVGIETVRVLIPCSREPFELVEASVLAALSAAVPTTISKHVYLLDDLPDERRRVWVQSMTGATRGCLHYRTRTPGANETNHRSCNLNASLQLLYGDLGSDVGRGACASELVAVLDADQVCNADFFTKTLEAMGDAAMLVTPRRAHNVHVEQDAFTHSNVQWYEYVLSGMSAWGSVNCSNTNFLVKADVLRAVGYFREEELGEFGLSVELSRRGYRSKYMQEYLTTGEAPEKPGSILREHSTWVKAHLQIFFGKANPILAKGLPLRAKFFYSITNWSFLVTAFTTPFFIIIPLLTLWYGIYPLDVTREFATVLVTYYSTLILTVYFSDNYRHTYQFWLGWVQNHIYWYTYLKAIFSVILSKMAGKQLTYKPTNKTGKGLSTQAHSLSMNVNARDPTENPFSVDGAIAGRRAAGRNAANKTPRGDNDVDCGASRLFCDFWGSGTDVFVLLAVLLLSGGTAIVGGFWMIGQVWTDWKVVQMVSVLWCLQNAVPPYIFFHYLLFRRRGLDKAAWIGSVVVLAATVVSFVILILYSRKTYDYGEVLDMSMLYFEAQRSGVLPPDNRIPWRGDSGLLDKTEDGRSLVGGYYDAGDTIKFGLPMATSISLLAWGLLEFPKGYTDIPRVHDTLKWGTDYFIKCHTAPNEFYAQVGTGTGEHKIWMPPEEMLKDWERIGFKLNETRPGSDVVGSTAAALAATSMVFKKHDPMYSAELLQHARELYDFGNGFRGKYSDIIPDAKKFYPSTNFEDDLAWGAIWLYEATREKRYLDEAKGHIDDLLRPIESENRNPSSTFDWDSVSQGASLLIYRETNDKKYMTVIDRHIDTWMNDIERTPRGLVWPAQAGVLRQVANTALIFLVYAKNERARGVPLRVRGIHECWAREQILYMLGEGGRSFVVGYGRNPPKRVHHRGATCPQLPASCGWGTYRSDEPNHNILVGGLVGGPAKNDVYFDDRRMIKQSEVAIDYNAGFAGVLAALRELERSTGFGKCLQGIGMSTRFRVVGSTGRHAKKT